MANQDADRIEREKQYHNERFSEETREAQARYYTAVQDCFEDFRNTVTSSSQEKLVLEYGCAKGDVSLRLAPVCKHISGIDISDVAINQARETASERSLKNTRFEVMDAENMTFEDQSFDLVFGSGIIHHLDVDKAFGEISRVLKPGGRAIFVEPLGHNPLINAYRRLTPEARTPDEHPLKKPDYKLAEQHFSKVESRFYGLATIGAAFVPKGKLQNAIYKVSRPIDKIFLSIPGMKWQAWYSLVILTR